MDRSWASCTSLTETHLKLFQKSCASSSIRLCPSWCQKKHKKRTTKEFAFIKHLRSTGYFGSSVSHLCRRHPQGSDWTWNYGNKLKFYKFDSKHENNTNNHLVGFLCWSQHHCTHCTGPRQESLAKASFLLQMSDWLLLHSICPTFSLQMKIQTLTSQWKNMGSSWWCKAGQLACDGYRHNAFCVVVGTWKSRLPGYYRNPGVKQSRSARFGVKRTEEDALSIVLNWMFAQHAEAEKRALNLSKWFNFSRYHFVSCRYNLGCVFFPGPGHHCRDWLLNLTATYHQNLWCLTLEFWSLVDINKSDSQSVCTVTMNQCHWVKFLPALCEYLHIYLPICLPTCFLAFIFTLCYQLISIWVVNHSVLPGNIW